MAFILCSIVESDGEHASAPSVPLKSEHKSEVGGLINVIEMTRELEHLPKLIGGEGFAVGDTWIIDQRAEK